LTGCDGKGGKVFSSNARLTVKREKVKIEVKKTLGGGEKAAGGRG